MEARKNFLTSLKKLIKELKTTPEDNKENKDIVTITNDINRTYLKYSKHVKDVTAIKFYRNILYEVFTKLPVNYYQGMTEIAAVIVDAYLTDEIAKLNLKSEDFSHEDKNEKLENKSNSNDSDSEENSSKSQNDGKLNQSKNEKNIDELKNENIYGREENKKNSEKIEEDQKLQSRSLNDLNSLEDTFEPIEENEPVENKEKSEPEQEIIFENNFLFSRKENQDILREYLINNEDKINEIRKVIFDIFFQKYIKLVGDNFSFYKKCNRTFVKMMAKKGVKIPDLYAMLTTKHILTFFCRDFTNTEDIYTIFRIIAENDADIGFSILFSLEGKIDIAPETDQVAIDSLPPHFKENVKEAHKEFKEVFEIVDEKEVPKAFLVAGAVVSAVAIGFAIFMKSRKDK
ncbi:hypothetical protein NUSPORA_00121 [Nucleospora cyclopteri]